MLAPLKDRSLIERESPLSLEERVAQLESANLALRTALRQSRQVQKRSATLSARKIVALSNEVSRLETLHSAARQRVERLESGEAIVELGQQLYAALVVSGTGAGRTDPPRGAVEQAGGQALLQCGDLAGDGGGGDVQGIGGGAEAIALDHRDKHPHGIDGVHCFRFRNKTLPSRLFVAGAPGNNLCAPQTPSGSPR